MPIIKQNDDYFDVIYDTICGYKIHEAIKILEKYRYKQLIPVGWIKNYASHKASKDFIDCYWHFWEDDVLKMVAEWEKENATKDND